MALSMSGTPGYGVALCCVKMFIYENKSVEDDPRALVMFFDQSRKMSRGSSPGWHNNGNALLNIVKNEVA
jgi:hypothetical protein